MNADFFKRLAPDRYYVDERVGCVAVRDRTVQCDSPCCAPDLPGVVRYWRGQQVSKTCLECGHVNDFHYEVAKEDVESAWKLCEEMNRGR